MQNYLFLFAQFVILKFPFDKTENAFLYFIDLIKDKGLLLDIGSNIGVTSYFFSKKKPGFEIYSFEPVPINLKTSRKLFNRYNLFNIRLFPFALGDRNKMVDMIMPEKNKVFFHGLSHVKNDANFEKGALFSVEMKRLDEIKELENKNIVAIKIDVEEYEFQVLMGGKKVIQQNRPLVYCELWLSENREKCLDFFRQLNYKAYIRKGKRLKEYTGQKKYQNFFFLPLEYGEKFNL